MNEDSTRSRTAYDPASDPLVSGAFQTPSPPHKIPRKWPEHLKPYNSGQVTYGQYPGFNPVSVTSVTADSIYTQSEHFPPSHAPPKRQRVKHTLKAWTPELLWCLVSIGCLVAIVATLNAINHKPQPKLPLNVPITAVIAFLATFCRMTLTFPVIEGVSQLKWNWYAEGKTRPLGNLETFDLAGRGAWGSMKLLWIARGRYAARSLENWRSNTTQAHDYLGLHRHDDWILDLFNHPSSAYNDSAAKERRHKQCRG